MFITVDDSFPTTDLEQISEDQNKWEQIWDIKLNQQVFIHIDKEKAP